MKLKKLLFVALIVLLFALTACAKCEDRLNGKWTLKSMKMGDQNITAKDLGGQSITWDFDIKAKTLKSVMGTEKEEKESISIKECTKDKIVLTSSKKKEKKEEGEKKEKKEDTLTIVFTSENEITVTNSIDQGEMVLTRGGEEKKQ